MKLFRQKKPCRLLNKLEFHYTPKHGSWLNMAEIEFSALKRQCLDCRIPDQETLKQKIVNGNSIEIRKRSKQIGNSKPKMHELNSEDYIHQ
ncbi:MAG: transposase [Candidatus Competibacteraceae bacterium]|nr:transposase [Candidatus Competibacteraceae bacterium]